MRMYDIIEQKKKGGELSKDEINYFINGYVAGKIPDYQVSALLMAICFNGMTGRETADLTMAMAKSGDMADLSSVPGIKVDKHSTGGVGDKTTLVVLPIVASLGVPVAKMSGRGLGHTGGTLDKLESIPGFKVSIGMEQFLNIVRTVGASVIGQSGNLVPADKKLYALRDVTATVDSIPLIASSIMSKKIAAGADRILLDVKTGSGAFMKTVEDSVKLAEAMVAIGEESGRRTVALVTNMDQPLGKAVGNALEIQKVCMTLRGTGPRDLYEICMHLAANMLCLAGKGSLKQCRVMAEKSIADGSAYEKLKQMVAAQGGDVSVLDDTSKFDMANIAYDVKAEKDGFVHAINAELCGTASMQLGAGRETKDDVIDYSAGIVFNKKVGDSVKRGETVATLYTSSDELCKAAAKTFTAAFSIDTAQPEVKPYVYARITKDGVQYISDK